MTASSTVVDTVQPSTSSQTPGSTHTTAEFTEKSTAADVGEKNKDNPVPVSALVSASASVEGATTEYPHGWRLAAIVVAIILAIFLASLDMTIVATAIPKITDQFRGLDKVSWYGSAFFMVNGAFQSSWGKAYRYFNLKSTFLASVFVFEVGSLICGVAQNATTLIVGRGIAGLGAAGIGTGAYTIIAFIVEPQKRAKYTGFVGASFGVASVLGPLLGGVFAEKVTWRWSFLINLPIGGLAMFIIVFFFHTPAAAAPVPATWSERLLQMDLPGVALAMGALVSLTLALQYAGQTKPWSSSTVIGLFVACAVITILLVIWEWRQGERAMVVPRLFKQSTVGCSCLFAFTFAGYLIIYVLPIYFQSVKGTSPVMSGVYNLPLIASVTLAMIGSGIFISATGMAVHMLVVGSAVATIASGLLYTLEIDSGTGKWVGYQILMGTGWGLAFQVPIILSQSQVEPAEISSVTAMVLLFQCIGGGAFISAAQTAFVNRLILALPSTAPGIDPAVVVMTGATEIRTTFAPNEVVGIVKAYMTGIKTALAIPIAAIGVAFLVSLFAAWRTVIHRKRLSALNSPTA